MKGDVVDDVGETVPQEAVLQATAHVTPLLDESFAMVAVICAVLPASTVLAEEEAETEMARVEPPLHPTSKPKLANTRTNTFFTLASAERIARNLFGSLKLEIYDAASRRQCNPLGPIDLRRCTARATSSCDVNSLPHLGTNTRAAHSPTISHRRVEQVVLLYFVASSFSLASRFDSSLLSFMSNNPESSTELRDYCLGRWLDSPHSAHPFKKQLLLPACTSAAAAFNRLNAPFLWLICTKECRWENLWELLCR